MPPSHVHFNGSVNLADAESVMREITARVPSGLRRIPDGETGDRAGWIFYQAHKFLQLPSLVPVQPFDPAEGDYEHMPQLRLADGVDPATVKWPDPGYADAYLRSYETFTALREEGIIPAGTRFQVEYPTPLASISAYVVPEQQQTLLPAYEQAMFADLDRLLAAIPRDEIAVQWDVAVEFSLLEEFFGPIGPQAVDAIIANLARCVDTVPAEVPVGLHLCYGDWGHQHFKQPESLGPQVRLLNAVAAAADRTVSFVSFTVPQYQRAESYFAPLAGLATGPDTELNFGIVPYHPEDQAPGTTGDQARLIDAALADSPGATREWGVCTECGMGRAGREEMPVLLDLHRQIVAAGSLAGPGRLLTRARGARRMAGIGQQPAVAGRRLPRRFHVTWNGRGASSGAAAIVTALADAGTKVVFGLPGGGPNLDVVGAAAAAGLRFVLAHTETAAVIMAATYADLTGLPGAAVVTRGPGLASAVNGIAHAALDRLPVVVIADTVRLADADRISHQRLDQAALGRVVAKAVVAIGRDRTAEAAAEAVRLALMPPAGPVVALMDDSGLSEPGGAPRPERSARVPENSGSRDVAVLAQALRSSRRPVVMLGTGAIAHTAAIRSALAGRGIPALHTYRARGIVPDSAAEAAGLVTGGTMEWPLLAAADAIVGLGVDEAEMIPAAWDYPAPVLLVAGYPPGRPGSAYFPGARALDIPLPVAIGVLADSRCGHDWPPGAGQLARTQAALRLSEAPQARPGFLSPVQVAGIARSHVPQETVVTVDAGAHMLAVMPLWEVTEPGRLLISSGLATMGFALPAAIAAALCGPARLVVAFTGDGGLGMTLAEIETAVRLRLRIAVVVFNDGALSLIKVKQRPAGHGGAEAVAFWPVSYARAAEAMGAAAVAVSTEMELAAALSAASGRDGPTVIDVQVDPAGYPAIMDLSRGDAGRRPVPGLPGPGSRAATVNVMAGTLDASAATVRSTQCQLPWRNSRMLPRAPSQASSRSANARPCRA